MKMEIPIVSRLLNLVRRGKIEQFVTDAHEVQPADLADVLTSLSEEERLAVVQVLPPEVSSKALIEMPEEAHAEETLAALDSGQAAEIVEELRDDEAADILGEMEPEDQERILNEVEDPEDVERLLEYDPETAGGLMTSRLVVVVDDHTANQALEDIRRQSEEVGDFSQVFVTDGQHRLLGFLPLKDLVISPPDRPVREIMAEADIRATPEMDQEEVARIMRRYNVGNLPVVDNGGRLLGAITLDDAIDVVEEEQTEDILKFSGASANEDIGAGWRAAVRSRLPWLYVNLVTAFLAAAVVLFFQDTLQRLVILSAWMPIVAGMGGNAGTQALAVTVRRLALGLVPTRQFLAVVSKEALVGLLNGLAIGVVVAGVALAAGKSPAFGLVVFLAMSGNLFVAGFAGGFIPILLERFKVDPAVASSIFVTTFTDMCGFFLLLGLATRLLL